MDNIRKFSRQDWDDCIALWRGAEQRERKYGHVPMANVLVNTIKELEIEREGQIVHINKRCGVGGPTQNWSMRCENTRCL